MERRELHWSMGQTALPGSELPDYSDTEILKEEHRQRQSARTRTAATTRVHHDNYQSALHCCRRRWRAHELHPQEH